MKPKQKAKITVDVLMTVLLMVLHDGIVCPAYPWRNVPISEP